MSHQPTPPHKKDDDKHIGVKGRGVWLRFTKEDEQGQVLIEYEVCGCSRYAPRQTALSYLHSSEVQNRRVRGMCAKHVKDPVALLERQKAELANGSGQKREAHRQREDRDRWLLEIIAKIAERWRKFPDTEDASERQDNLARIKQEYIANDLMLTITGLRGRLDTCGWREMFPKSKKRRFPDLVTFIAESLDQGNTEEIILNDLRALNVTGVQKACKNAGSH